MYGCMRVGVRDSNRKGVSTFVPSSRILFGFQLVLGLSRKKFPQNAG